MRQKALLCPSLPRTIGPASLASHIRAARSAAPTTASSKVSRPSKGLNASPRSSNDHDVSRGFCRAYRSAFSIARLDADHPVPPLLSLHSPNVSRSFGLLALV